MKKCRFHSNVYKEMVGSFDSMNEALEYEKNNPRCNGEIYTYDGHLLKENFECECKGTGNIPDTESRLENDKQKI